MTMRILAVDDEPAVACSLSFVLGTAERKLATACNGEEALKKIAAEAFDIVITDNNMPRLDGLELVRRLRQQNFRGKIVVLSAHLTDERMRQYSELAVDRMLHKPFNIHELRRGIDELAAAA